MVDAFDNASVALRIVLSLPRNRCVGRTFILQAEELSKTVCASQSVKNVCLHGSAMLSIENDTCKHIPKNDLIDHQFDAA